MTPQLARQEMMEVKPCLEDRNNAGKGCCHCQVKGLKEAGAAQTPFYAEFADKDFKTSVGTGKRLRAEGGPHNLAIPK